MPFNEIPFDIIRSNIFPYLPINPNYKYELHEDIKKLPLKKKWTQIYKEKFKNSPNDDNYYYYWLEHDIECFLNNNIPALFELTNSYASFLKRLCEKLGKRRHYTISLDSKYTVIAYMKTLTYAEFISLDDYLTNLNR